MEQKISRIPVLFPNSPRSFSCMIESLSETGKNDNVTVFLSSTKSSKPIISSIVNIPIAEPLTV